MKHIKLFEEHSTLNEYSDDTFKMIPGDPIDPNFFVELMPKTAKTAKEAESHLKTFEGGKMFVHVQYFVVKPKNDLTKTYRFHQRQYWLNDFWLRGKKKVNTTLLTIIDITDPKKENDLGSAYVDTDVFLNECKDIFNMSKTQS